jgi:hypothetical protein
VIGCIGVGRILVVGYLTAGRNNAQNRDTYYVPSCPLRILSLQHCSQQTKDLRGTYSANFGDQVIFVWNKSKFRVTVPLSPTTNIGILRSAPGHKVFSSFVGSHEPTSALHFCCPVISDDKADEYESTLPGDDDDDDDDNDDDTLSPAASPEGERGGGSNQC